MITPYVYKHTNLLTGQYYIGSRGANKTMPVDDLPIYICSSKLVKPLIKENPTIWQSEVLGCFFTREDAFVFEQTQIEANWGDPLLLNLHYRTSGRVFLSYEKSLETRQKISKSLSGRTRSKTHCDAISAANKGKSLSKSTIEKIVAKNTGKTRTPIQKARMSESQLGHTVSEQTRQKISEANTGRPQPKGKHSRFSKPFICIETGVVFFSQPEAASVIGCRPGDINNVLNGRQKTTKGFSFRFV